MDKVTAEVYRETLKRLAVAEFDDYVEASYPGKPLNKINATIQIINPYHPDPEMRGQKVPYLLAEIQHNREADQTKETWVNRAAFIKATQLIPTAEKVKWESFTRDKVLGLLRDSQKLKAWEARKKIKQAIEVLEEKEQ